MDQIKVHPFFYGVDWDAIRNIDAPFVPHLRSITDTSYFPTEDLEAVPDQPVGADTDGSNKDLAFLGCVTVIDTSWLDIDAQSTTQVHVQAVHNFVVGDVVHF